MISGGILDAPIVAVDFVKCLEVVAKSNVPTKSSSTHEQSRESNLAFEFQSAIRATTVASGTL